MADMKKEYIKVIKIAMIAMYEAENTNQLTVEQWRILNDAMKEICPLDLNKYYTCKGGKYHGEGILDGIAADHVSAHDFIEISKEEFEYEEPMEE